jgi:hypothetical protein
MITAKDTKHITDEAIVKRWVDLIQETANSGDYKIETREKPCQLVWDRLTDAGYSLKTVAAMGGDITIISWKDA